MRPISSLNNENENSKPSMSIMKQRFFRKASQLVSKTNFTCIEIEGLLRIFDKIVQKYNSPMTKTVFKDVMFNFFSLTNDIMMEKMYRALSTSNNILTYDDWVRGMNVFLRGPLIQLADFAFSVYDHQKRDYLAKEDVQFYLKEILVVQLPDEDADELQTDMLDMIFALLDKDKDGYISRKDFVRAVLSEPLLLQILGECIPSRKEAQVLDSLIKEGNENF